MHGSAKDYKEGLWANGLSPSNPQGNAGRRGKHASFRCFARLALVIVAAWSTEAHAGQWGEYLGKVVVEWLETGREMKLIQDFAYRDPEGRLWNAPAGSIVNGASIPKIAWSIVGGPFEGKYRDASVIHDVACDERARRWEDVHLAFYTAMLASGVETLRAKVMYAAVYHFGPRWERRYRITEVPSSQAESRITALKSQATREYRVLAQIENPRFVENGGGPLASIPGVDEPREVVDINVRVVPRSSTIKEAEFARLREDIETKNLGLEQIRGYEK